MKKSGRLVIGILVTGIALYSLSGCSKNGYKPFYIYTEDGSEKNHYSPTGLMGDHGALTVVTNCAENPRSGKTCIKVTYTGKVTNASEWAGMYWQEPANNWADLEKGGFDLTGATKLTFWARGAQGGETISEFKVGGMQGKFPDTDLYNIGPIVLTKEWKKYEIPFNPTPNLKRISGGFCWAAAQKDDPNGFIMYLDEIVYE